MYGKHILITGGTGGIGFQTAIALARQDAHVMLTGRTRATGEAAVAQIRQASGNAKVELLVGDVSKQADIREIARQVAEKPGTLDVLINNAGSATSRREVTVDGVERNFAVNVVAPLLLTILLQGALQEAGIGRVVTLMGGDVPNSIESDNLQAERSFDGLKSYSQSKLVMMVVMTELAQRMEPTGIAMNIAYPGQASTTMTRAVTADMLPRGMRWLYPIFKLMTRPDGGKSAQKASRSSVYLATSADGGKQTGKYFGANCKAVTMPGIVFDPAVRANVWSSVSQLAGLET